MCLSELPQLKSEEAGKFIYQLCFDFVGGLLPEHQVLLGTLGCLNALAKLAPYSREIEQEQDSCISRKTPCRGDAEGMWAGH